MTKNPYLNHGPNLVNSATSVFAIAPSDDADLPKVIKALRVWNPDAAAATIHYRTVDGDEVTVSVPASTLWTEPAVMDKVFATGTSATLVLHGYSD